MTCASVINEGSLGAGTVLCGTGGCNVITSFGTLNSLLLALWKPFDSEKLISSMVEKAGIVGDLSEN